MTLQDVTDSINHAQSFAATDSDTALKLNTDVFLNLMRENEAYIIPAEPVDDVVLQQGLYKPYIAPAQDADTRLFLRVFSHQEAVKLFSGEQAQMTKIDGVELLQLAKFHFLRGVYGIILNDGTTWAALSMPDLLIACYDSILGDSTMGNDEYIALVRLINMVRQNEHYHLISAQSALKSATNKDKIIITEEAKREGFNNDDFIFESLTLDKLSLLAAPGQNTSISIRTAKINYSSISPDMLRCALASTGVIPGHDTEFHDTLDFRVNSISLDYSVQDFDATDIPAQNDVQIVEVPHTGNTKKPSIIAFINRVFKGFAFKSSKHKSEAKPNTHSQISLATKIRHLSISAVVIATLFLGFSLMTRQSPAELISTAIEVGNYEAMPEIFEKGRMDASNKADMLQMMSTDLRDKVSLYADGKIRAEDLRLIIDSYASISEMSSATAEAYEKAALLEQSKNTFHSGLTSNTVSDRLSLWLEVNKEDTASQVAIEELLRDKHEEYRESVFRETSSLEPFDALAKLYTLQSFYPNDNEISAHIKLLQSRQGSGSSLNQVPISSGIDITSIISIHSIALTKSSVPNSVDLVIDWENVSTLPIQSVVFTLVPYYDSNTKLTIIDNGEEKSLKYMATDSREDGVFEGGFRTAPAHRWSPVWTGDFTKEISIISLDMVSIIFEGDETPIVIVDAEDLARLLQP